MGRWARRLLVVVCVVVGCDSGGGDAPIDAGGADAGVPRSDAGPAPDGGVVLTPEERLASESREASNVRVVRGSARTVSGSFPSSAGATPEQAAKDLIGRHPDLFGVADPTTELVLRDVRGEPGEAQVVVLDRAHRGLPVFGAEVRVAVEPGGTITYVGARLPHAVDVAVTPTVTAMDATTRFVTALATAAITALPDDTPVLGVYDQDVLLDVAGPTVLAWRLTVTETGGEGRTLGAFVDASDGTVLHAFDVTLAVQERLVGSCNPGSLGFGECAAAMGHRQLYTEAGPVTTMPPPADVELFRRAGLLHGWAGDAYGYLQTRFGRDSWNGSGGALRFFVGITESNAYWTPGIDAMFFHPRFETRDVVVHEITHGIAQDEAALAGWGQPGAIGESLGDVLAAFVDGDWQMLRSDGSVMRDLAQGLTHRTATHYPEGFRAPPAGACMPGLFEMCLQSSHDMGWVHYNSALPSLVVYLLTVGGRNPARSGDTPVPALGRAKTEQIVYRALRDYLLATSTFDDLRYQMLRACTDLVGRHGIGLEDCGAVLDAFAAVGIGAWDRDHDTWGDDCGGITAPGCVEIDNCPDRSNADQFDSDHDGLGDACETDVGPCDLPRVSCPAVLSAASLTRTLSTTGSTTCPMLHPTSGWYHATCLYEDTPGGGVGVSFTASWYPDRRGATLCRDERRGSTGAEDPTWYGGTGRAWVQFVGYDAEVMDGGHDAVALGLLRQAEVWAEPCGRIFDCPGSFTDDVATWTLNSAASSVVPTEFGMDTATSSYDVRVFCAYDRPGGSGLGDLALGCKWGDRLEHHNYGAPAWCLPPLTYEARSTTYRAVCWLASPTTYMPSPGLATALFGVLPQAEANALPCP